MVHAKTTDQLRSLVPAAARKRLYGWHPGRGRRWNRHPGVQRVAGEGQAVLTFDDGPDEDATPEVLDALSRENVRATFFLLASQVEAHPDLAEEIVRRGHEIGLHGYWHHRQDRIGPEESRNDLTRGYRTIEAAVGTRCRWYRPPYGKMSDAASETCRALSMAPVYWSAWGLDWEDVRAERIAEVASAQLDDGAVVLLHDSARYARRASARPTAQAIPMITERAQARGISFLPLGEAGASAAEARS